MDAWIEYFQMGELTGCLCVEIFCKTIAQSTTYDRIFTITLGLSQSLVVQVGTHNPNLTLKGYPKKLWGLFGQKAHKTQQIT